jgi:hypothetical protein
VLVAGCALIYAISVTRGFRGAPSGFAREDLFRFSAKWWSYLVPPVAHPWLSGFAEHVWNSAGVRAGLLEQQVSLGWAVIAAASIAIYFWIRRDQHDRMTSIVPALATLAAVALLCSLSPERSLAGFVLIRPSGWFYTLAPMFRSYARFGVVVQLMTALLAGIGLERLWRRQALAPRIACVMLVVVAGVEYAVWPPSSWRDVLPTAAHRWTADRPGRVHALDCARVTTESQSVEWLSAGRISLAGGALDDCAEPELARKMAASGYTHLILRHGTDEQRWFASRATPEGLQSAAHFDDGDVFAVTAEPPLVFTARMTDFYPRESDRFRTWRWMGSDASWRVVNRTKNRVMAMLDVEITAFPEARRLKLLLDGREVQSTMVGPQRGFIRLGPLTLVPGEHDLLFRPVDPPVVADDRIGNGDPRLLSFAFGTWHWTVNAERP